MEQQILEAVPIIKEILEKDYDVLIRKNKQGEIKVLYCKPKNFKKDKI